MMRVAKESEKQMSADGGRDHQAREQRGRGECSRKREAGEHQTTIGRVGMSSTKVTTRAAGGDTGS